MYGVEMPYNYAETLFNNIKFITMKNLIKRAHFALYILLVAVLFTGCLPSSKPSDLEPIINARFKDAKSIYYPSSSFQVSAIVVDKNGNVWYMRMSASRDMRDQVQLFNVKEHCN